MIVESPLLLGVHGVVGLAMAGAGSIKLVGHESQVEEFEEFGYPQWFRVLVGGLELFGAVGLVVGLAASPALAVASGVVVAAVLLGALGTHVRVGDPVTAMVPAAILLVGVLFVVTRHAPAVL